MFGNCGVGFAPVKKHHRGALMDLMEGVEEIPNPVLAAGLTWEWESFPDFMDALERRERAIDICAQAAHLPMRVYVMGDRAIRREPATADDIAEMRHLTVEALQCRRLRLHHLAHRFAQDAGRRVGALARCRRR